MRSKLRLATVTSLWKVMLQVFTEKQHSSQKRFLTHFGDADAFSPRYKEGRLIAGVGAPLNHCQLFKKSNNIFFR